MRAVSLSNGKTIEVGPLTHEQIVRLGPIGFSFVGFNPKLDLKDPEGINQTLTTLIECLGLDVPWQDYHKIFLAVSAESYGNEEEEKNSSGSGPSDQTPK